MLGGTKKPIAICRQHDEVGTAAVPAELHLIVKCKAPAFAGLKTLFFNGDGSVLKRTVPLVFDPPICRRATRDEEILPVNRA